MVSSTATPAAPSTSTFVFTEEQDRFIFFYMAKMRADLDELTTLFNRYFETSLSDETIACAAYRIQYEGRYMKSTIKCPEPWGKVSYFGLWSSISC